MGSFLAERAPWCAATAALLCTIFVQLAAPSSPPRDLERYRYQAQQGCRELVPKVQAERFRDPNIDDNVESVLVRCTWHGAETQVRTSATEWQISERAIKRACVAEVLEAARTRDGARLAASR
jgi:hypothetical protein